MEAHRDAEPSLLAEAGASSLADADASPLSRAHLRFARAALLIYFGATAVALVSLAVIVATERRHEEHEIGHAMLLDTEVRARFLSHHVTLLAGELRRLRQTHEIRAAPAAILRFHEFHRYELGVGRFGHALA